MYSDRSLKVLVNAKVSRARLLSILPPFKKLLNNENCILFFSCFFLRAFRNFSLSPY